MGSSPMGQVCVLVMVASCSVGAVMEVMKLLRGSNCAEVLEGSRSSDIAIEYTAWQRSCSWYGEVAADVWCCFVIKLVVVFSHADIADCFCP